jgi:hypothetical protein
MPQSMEVVSMNATTRYLGRNPSRHDPRTLQLRSYEPIKLPTPPAECRWDSAITDWGVMGNDTYGNCVIATAGHLILAWRANELHDTTRIADAAVVELSKTMGALHGYNILDRLKYWRKNQMWANPVWAFAQTNPTDATEIRNAISIFGAADIGINLPNAWRTAEVWDTGTGRAYNPGSWGGHSVPIVGYDASYLYVVTWGAVQKMTWAALLKYCDESYAIIDRDWLAAETHTTPSGYDLAAMHADLQAITA